MELGFYNDDCMNIMSQMDAGCVDLFITDIPYDGVNDAQKKIKGAPLRVTNKGAADIITFDLETFLEQAYRITKGTIIIFCGINQVSNIFNYYFEKQKAGGGTVRQLIWHKINPSPMNGEHFYLSATENAIFFRKQKATFNAHCKHNVFNYPTGSSEMHPTEKNHQLLADLIQDNSNIGDVVFDACAGSGSTLYVAHRLGRKVGGGRTQQRVLRKGKSQTGCRTGASKYIRLNGLQPLPRIKEAV